MNTTPQECSTEIEMQQMVHDGLGGAGKPALLNPLIDKIDDNLEGGLVYSPAVSLGYGD